MTEVAWRWSAVIICLLVGAILVGYGLLEGDVWASLAGGVLSGGTGVVAVRK